MSTLKPRHSSDITTFDQSGFRPDSGVSSTGGQRRSEPVGAAQLRVGRASILLTVALTTLLSLGSIGCSVDTSSDNALADSTDGALDTMAGDPCVNPSFAPVEKKTFASRDSKLGDALFMFYDFDKSSRKHIVPIEKDSHSHVYIVEVGSQSRDPNNTKIIARKTSSTLRRLGGGGTTDKYQTLHELTSRSATSVTFDQPIGGGMCIRDEGQYVVIYTNKVVKLIKATMRDPELTGGHVNQYSGAPNEFAISLIADDETNHPNRITPTGATTRMLASSAFHAFENKDNGFFLYKAGQKVPTFTGNGCDAQYQF
jgi:hypothetical protein